MATERQNNGEIGIWLTLILKKKIERKQNKGRRATLQVARTLYLAAVNSKSQRAYSLF